jgi:predicted ester cyclase
MEPQLEATKPSPETPPPAIKEVARRFREDLWNSGDLSVADSIIAPDCLLHSVIPFPIDFARGPDAVRHLVFFYQMAFSEIRITAEHLVAEGDMVAVRWTARARHTGHLLGLPPTGRETVTTGIDMLRIVEGKIVEGWIDWDVLSLLSQIMDLGAKPEEGFLSLFERLRPR